MKNEPWTIAEETRLRREFPYKTNAELARAFGRSQQALCVKASKMGLKKDHYGIVWTKLKRSEALKYTWKQKKIKERIRKIYGI